MSQAQFLEIEIDKGELAELEKLLDPRDLDVITGAALNDTLKKLRSLITKLAAKKIGLKQKQIRRRMWIKKARRTRLTGRITGGRFGWPISHNKHMKQNEVGVIIGRGKKKKLHRHAFIATMPTGHRGAFVRKTSERLPLRELKTESITQVVLESGQLESLIRQGDEFLAKRLKQRVELHYERKAAKAAFLEKR